MSSTLANLCAKYAIAKKGIDVKVIDLKGLTDVADYYVIVSGESSTHINAIANEIEDKVLEKRKEKVWHREGTKGNHWILLDYVDVVVHLFLPDSRKFYGIEDFWGDAPAKEIKDTAERKKLRNK